MTLTNESSGHTLREHRAGPFCVSEVVHGGGLTLAPHEHEHACLHVVLAGCYRETTSRGERGHPTGAALFKPAGMRHANRFPQIGARTIRIEVDARSDDLRSLIAEPGTSDHPDLELLARQLRRELRAGEVCALSLEAICRDAIGVVVRARRSGPCPRTAERCAALLRERYADPALRLGALASELRCDRSGLARAFHKRFSCSMGDYVRALRVAHVMRLIERGEHSLARAALLAGFADQSHCTRVFRRIVGTTPGAWPSSTPRPRGERPPEGNADR